MIDFSEVTRAKSKARIAVTGPSGSGKTLSSMYLAYGITGDWSKVALIDTEHERGRFYANRTDLNTGKFLYASMTPPYTPDKYIEYVKSAADIVGSDGAIVVDSFSHCWDNEGGVLDIKSQIAQQRGKNDYTAWDEAGKIQNNLVNTILSVDCHTIITMRAKMAYAMEVNDRGKTVPVKIGLAPVQRENTEYEFDMCFQLDRTHNASLSKDTTFLDSWTGIITPELGKQLGEWLSKGVELPRCSDCGDVIMAYGKRTVKQIIDGTIKNYGRQLCMQCVAKLIKQKKQEKQREGAGNAASTVSE